MGLFLPGNDRRWASYDLEVAEKLGLNEAIILAQIIRSIEGHIDAHLTERFFRDGRWWMYDSMPALSKSTSLGMDTIRRTLTRLEILKIILRFQYELALGYGHYWYTIDAQILTTVLETTPPVQNHRVAPPTLAKPQGATLAKPQGATLAKPQGATLAKPYDLSITLNPITLNPITLNPIIHKNISSASVTPLKVKRPKKEKPPLPPDLLELGKRWHVFAVGTIKTKPYASWTDESFGEALAKVMRVTGKAVSEMSEILKFVETDEFWKPNALSPQSLLNISKTNGKRKIDNILDAIDRSKQQPKKGNYYERPKAVDISADVGGNKHEGFRGKPW